MLRRKLFRTMGRYKAQFISMVIMVALGMGVFLGFQMEWYTLDRTSTQTYEATGFADFRVLSDALFTREELEAVAAIPGVTDAARFLKVNVAVKGDTDLLGLSVTSNPKVSGIYVSSGEAYDPEAKGFWLSDQYAAKNGVRLGDELSLIYAAPFGTVELTAPVLGLAKASEYMICLQDGTQLMPDYNSYGFVYTSPAMLEEAMGMELYTQLNLISELSKEEIVPLIDRALGRTSLVLSKDEVVSWSSRRKLKSWSMSVESKSSSARGSMSSTLMDWDWAGFGSKSSSTSTDRVTLTPKVPRAIISRMPTRTDFQ